ncbi:MAG: amino acid adenylation domain-containing protein [Verrucomicrobiota bacterium]|nr:amino acid adenylation domain-containing protein [Verrucomicrobiota bacterium]
MGPETNSTEARRALLQRYLRGSASPVSSDASTIPRRNASSSAPLSYSQQQIWLHSRLAGDAPIYNEPITLRRHGELNHQALERSFTEVIRRHEAWRTTFVWDGDHGRQIVQPPPDHIALPLTDLSSHADAEREALRLATADAVRPFNLERGPMYRLLLVSLGSNDYRVFLTLHHIIFDGVSLYRVFLPELLGFYEAFVKNEKLSLPDLPIQYADYATWQRESVKAVPPEQLSYWQPICQDAPVLDLPTDRPRLTTQGSAGAFEGLVIGPATREALHALSGAHNATPFMTFVAAFITLLYGYTGDEDIVIGAVSSGRHHSETGGLLGCFLNTLPIRCRFSKDAPFTELLARVRSAVLGALSNADVPFELLVERFVPTRDLSRSPLAQVLIVVEPPLAPLPAGWEFSYLDVHTGTAKFDLQLGLDDREDGSHGQFIYKSDLFDSATIALMRERYLQLLETIVKTPTLSVSALTSAVWNCAKQSDLPACVWHGARTDYPRDASIHALYEEQARIQPSAVAAVFGATEITYAELNHRSNCLAHRLRERGVSREAPVGVCFERSLEMIVALLAVLKAGGAYVPLDPAYPTNRRKLMLEDTGARVVLTQTSLQQRLPGVELLCVDQQDFSDEVASDASFDSRGEDLAYIMYTSGSSGVPKGVAVPHRAVVRLVRNTAYCSFSADETFLHLASLSFDASTFEIWGALLNGGKLVIMPPAPPSLGEIGAAIQEHRVTTLWLTSALFHAMVDERLDDLQPIRQLLAGGDVLSVPHVRKAFDTLKNTRLINGYGPTESTTFACCHTVTSETLHANTVPIGKPIANTTAHILDTNLHPVPVGASGELYLGGDGLARGYWHRDELTAAKFVPDPFTADRAARLYKTGDQARWGQDGTIEFLGRIDRQIKLRGFRIELGEIEAAFKQQPEVRDCAVIVREDQPHQKRLVAYVVCENGAPSEFDKTSVMAGLKQTLPEHLLPNAIVSLHAFPRTSNGKLDRDALPVPENVTTSAKPTTPLEDALVLIWANVLGLERVGITDNFFELGGHSLLGLRLLNQVGAKLGHTLSLPALFQAPTVSLLAEVIVNKRETDENPALAPIIAVDRRSRRVARLR